jgi:CheY-like chemotaxis protein
MPFPFAPDPFPKPPAPRQLTALQGFTVLAVEDSRFASDALRLMCQRSGARLRRAETLAAADDQLAVFSPDVLLVDLGLPDGRGEVLLQKMAASANRPVLLGMSGDPAGREAAMAAGADGFLEKPFAGLVAFQAALLLHLPDGCQRLVSGTDTEISADPLAMRDDLVRAAAALRANPDPAERVYLSGFLAGIARQKRDAPLAAASAALAKPEAGLETIAGLVSVHLQASDPIRRRI